MKKRIGIVSYNIYCNFTNYGSALQSWALCQAIDRVGAGRFQPVLVDYCPDILSDKDPLDPFKNMWDRDEESRKMIELSLPAIHENYDKFDRFYHERFNRTAEKYTADNFNDIAAEESLDGFVCGSDTIFCPDEFGFDDGYYANYACMRGNAVAYAASFGDPSFIEKSYEMLDARLRNFKALGLRENLMIPYVRCHTSVPVEKTVDPTLLLNNEDYDKIAEERILSGKYLLLYARRRNPVMTEYAKTLAAHNGWTVAEISLQVMNADCGHKMFYQAGVEEFLSLVKYAEYVVTNSYHGMIFSIQYRRPFSVFSREQCDTKIKELLDLFGLSDRLLVTGMESFRRETIDYGTVHAIIAKERAKSIQFLRMELNLLDREGKLC